MAGIVNHPFKFEVERKSAVGSSVKLMILNALIYICRNRLGFVSFVKIVQERDMLLK